MPKQCPYGLLDAATHMKYFCQLECGHEGGHQVYTPKYDDIIIAEQQEKLNDDGE